MYKTYVTLFVMLAVLVMVSPAWATTYYVDATNGHDNNAGNSPQTAWKTIAKVNSSGFNPGDSILFKTGEEWREQLTVPSSGSSSTPIRLGAYGAGHNPIISGADLLTGWAQTSGNIYQVPCTWTLSTVFEDGQHLRAVAFDSEITITAAKMSPGTWTLDDPNDILYVWRTDGANPGTRTIEAPRRDNAIRAFNKDFVTLEYFEFRYANFDGVSIVKGENWVVRNILTHSNFRYGLFSEDGNEILYENSEAYNNQAGFSFGGSIGTRNSTMRQVRSYSNNYITNSDGIRVLHCDHCIIESSEVYGNDNGGSSDGIEVNASKATTVRFNYVHDNGNSSIIFHGGSYGEIYYNIVDGAVNGINLARLDHGNTTVYNNSCYNNRLHIIGLTPPYTLTIRNNIFHGGAGVAFLEEVSVDSSLVTLDNTIFFNTGGGTLITWKGANYTLGQFATYQEASAKDTSIVAQDPRFLDPVSKTFYPQSTSPGIATGVDVGLTRDYSGTSVPQGHGVDIGAYEFVYDDKLAPAAPTDLRIINGN